MNNTIEIAHNYNTIYRFLLHVYVNLLNMENCFLERENKKSQTLSNILSHNKTGDTVLLNWHVSQSLQLIIV